MDILLSNQRGDNMIKIILGSVLLIIIAISCTQVEDKKYASEGVITEIDIRECSCCGGYFIEIGDSTYRFTVLPPGSNVNLANPSFPIAVKLDWKASANRCLGDEIDVLRMQLR